MRILDNLKYVLVFCIGVIMCSCDTNQKKVLVFSKTAGFRHGSIEAGIAAIHKMGLENGFKVVTSEDAAVIIEDSLKTYDVVVFLNTSGDVLDDVQQADFERYIQAGGGFVGIHAATDTEHDWPWFTKLVGAQFKNHPEIQMAKLPIVDQSHPATAHLDNPWSREDEWYNFRNINKDINVLIEIDESSYEGGENGAYHPISWFHDYDGGRSFYTAMGHTEETFKDDRFLKHVLAGLQYAMSNGKLDYRLAKSESVPSENRFVKKVLDFNLDEPMEMAEIPGKGILFIERKGILKLFDFQSETTKIIGELPVFAGHEDGLLGLALDPDYDSNNWIYLFYSPLGDQSKQHISRFSLKAGILDLASEKILLEIPTIRECCHSGGSLDFDRQGNLYIATGDNTNPFESDGYAPIDERTGRALWDAQKSAANTNDLRGKILRIKPEDDGTYSIPEGNLFPPGTPRTRPEIYIMGCRNPFRFSLDAQTGYLYWGDIGPDAGEDDPTRGPKGMGEFNQARKAGFWGWPYTRGNNQAYNDYDFAKQGYLNKFDPNGIINDSPNNSGIQNLPEVQESMIWYGYERSQKFPWVGEGGVNPMAGPVFHKSDFQNADSGVFPEFFENKLFVYEWMRDWVYVVSLDENQNYEKAYAFMPNTKFSHPMDMIFGSDGNLYMLEYGQIWYARNLDARLSKISYISGNLEPVARIVSDKEIGAVPLTVNFSGATSIDYDGDKLQYKWSVLNDPEIKSHEKEAVLTFSEPGIYQVQLEVTDAVGNTSVAKTKILAGNDQPQIAIEIQPEDYIYGSTKKVDYRVKVSDAQDGSTEDGTISADKVKVTFSYIPEGEDLIAASVGHQQNTVPEGKVIMDGSDCRACHALSKKINGPSYEEIAKKYSKEDRDYLISRIQKGGSGVWGASLMSAHPQLEIDQTGMIVDYILSLDMDAQKKPLLLPLSGTLEFKDHLNNLNDGTYILMASYIDEGIDKLPNAALSNSNQVRFEPATVSVEDAEHISEGIEIWDMDDLEILGPIVHDGYVGFENVNAKGLKSITISAYYEAEIFYEGVLEVRENNPTGKIIGSSKIKFYGEEEMFKKQLIKVSPTGEHIDLFLVFKNENTKDGEITNLGSIVLNY
ncbi:ThuA domain-containing protein [Seonamhaeicola sp.]|uniref:ThuA domain-containing protein n=1 Tax=Seonamhaeicola sp. TaxID=1912245 RepID=UPI00262CAA15|nr:ThuA domain-containing protein [Seonamhaeicola sp.]